MSSSVEFIARKRLGGHRRLLPVLAVVALTISCTKTSRPGPSKPTPISSDVGECAALEVGGRVSASPDIRRADRDLNRDGREEAITSDRQLCKGENCHWNVFAWDGGCHRFIGTVSGAAIETGEGGESGFPELRSWWRFSRGERALLHVYRFGGEGYQLIETLMCRAASGDGIQCALEEPL